MIGHNDQCARWVCEDPARTAETITWLSVIELYLGDRVQHLAWHKKESVGFKLQGFQDLSNSYLKKRSMGNTSNRLSENENSNSSLGACSRIWELTESSQKILRPSWVCKVGKWGAPIMVGDIAPFAIGSGHSVKFKCYIVSPINIFSLMQHSCNGSCCHYRAQEMQIFVCKFSKASLKC